MQPRDYLKILVTGCVLWSGWIVCAQTTELDEFVDKDLWRQPPSKKARRVLEKYVGKIPDEPLRTGPIPWHVWKRIHDGQTRYIVLLGKQLMIIPGGSSASIQLFDASAHKINEWWFKTGWRIGLAGASVEYSSDLAKDLIALRVAPVINGKNVAKEYFALSKDRLRFVRLENNKGEFIQNEYGFTNNGIGLPPDANTVEQWIALLESQDKADVLSALVYLGGKFDGDQDEVIGNPRLLELITHLNSSDDTWIRQAADLALRAWKSAQVTSTPTPH